ncbi:xylulokinase [Marinactinospora thermotolerans DSM 45154]|uniref:Xylulokinase n=1 Tax=Marinactinospora thermotolerans DSM 45154 TaxID=1122192 RepID=A0A1T4RKZ2_9ACTN|nr:FGGY family carbohydrate kinase [Marinactinospora thermotolerans]SKA16664.1 xylulokinase [Marinactinospora thermotolerans DSM 45154]
MVDVAVVDVGTAAVKAALVDSAGRVRARAVETHPTDRPRPGWVEQDPRHWWDAVVRALRATVPPAHDLGALVVTGQMQDLVAVDDDGPLRPAILYTDHRAVAEHEGLRARLGADWERVTRNAQDSANLAAKLRWLLLNEPEVHERARHVLLGAHSYVVWRATGHALCDATTASTTGLFDARARGWWEEPLRAAGVRADLLPELIGGPGTDRPRPLAPGPARELGLSAGLPVVHAPGDALTTTLGITGGRSGADYAYLGTSGWLAAVVGRAPKVPGTVRLAAEGETELLIAPTLNAGSAADWARRALLGDPGHAAFDEALRGVGAATHGLIALPYLDGERAPHADPFARGAFVGMTGSTTGAQLAVAVLEGVAFVYRTLREAVVGTAAAGPLPVCGGASRSDVWCSLLANALGVEVQRVEDADTGLRGAHRYASGVLGTDTPELTEEEPRTVFAPDPETAVDYERAYALHRELYPRLSPVMTGLAAPAVAG